eukprot:2529605-Pyramimonas_sp.AAC.1
MRKPVNGTRNLRRSELLIQSADHREGAAMPTCGGRSTGTLPMMDPTEWMYLPRLSALQPRMLGGASAKFYGEASEVAPWRWAFGAAAERDTLRDVEGVARRARQPALAERLDAAKFLYPTDQEDPRPDPAKIERVTQVLTAWADSRVMALARADSLSFATERALDLFAC